MRHWFERNGGRMCDGLLHAKQCGIMTSRSVGCAGLLVSIPRPFGVTNRQIIQKSAKS